MTQEQPTQTRRQDHTEVAIAALREIVANSSVLPEIRIVAAREILTFVIATEY